MKPRRLRTPDSTHVEIKALLDVLLKTGRRLEELTSGQVDTAVDPEGRMLLLRGTPEQLEQNEVARQAEILNALPANVALLDIEGTILSVNGGWRSFAIANAMQFQPGHGIGVNYLAVCDAATGVGADEARVAASGIRSVLNGSHKSFSFDYDCSSHVEERWFKMSVTPLASDSPNGVIVAHENITASKLDQSNLVSLANRLSLATDVAKIGVWE